MQTNFHTTCHICNSADLKDLQEYSKDFLTKCMHCQFVFSKKIFTASSISETYDHYKRQDYLSPITIKRYHELLNQFEKYKKTNRILDVGCGIGYFLEIAKQRGWEVYGTEYTQHAIDICKSKGINMLNGNLKTSEIEPEYFDIITSFEVIEHLENPNSMLENSILFLRKGGLYYITTPNFNSLSRYLLKSKWVAVIGAPEHLCYFTPKTLKKLCSIHKLISLKIKTTGISLSSLKGEYNTSTLDFIHPDRTDEKLRNNVENSSSLQLIKSVINFSLSLTYKGDTIKAFFIKK